jgi:hypothetical protein
MNSRRCLRIAERIQLPFEQQTGVAIDPQRMVADGGYALDVLTVCDAYPGTPLATLAQYYRLVAAEPTRQTETAHAAAHAPSTGWGADTTGFGASRPQTNSAFEQQRQAARAARNSRGWMSPARWQGHDT